MRFALGVFLLVVAVAITGEELSNKNFDELTQGVQRLFVHRMNNQLEKQCQTEDNFFLTAKESLMQCVNGVNVGLLPGFPTSANQTDKLRETLNQWCKTAPVLTLFVSNFTESIQTCLNENEKNAASKIIRVLNDTTKFYCLDNGDLLIRLYNESGIECARQKRPDIISCAAKNIVKLKEEVGKAAANGEPGNTIQAIDKNVICPNLQEATDCVMVHLRQCASPTTALYFGGLIGIAMKATPCDHNSTALHRDDSSLEL